MFMTLEPVFSIQEVAKWLKVSERTIWRWIEQNQIKVIRLGTGKKNLTRITASEIERIGGVVKTDDKSD